MKPTTQSFLLFEQIKEGVVVLKNKALRGVLMVSSLNFELKSDEEQEATIYQFQSFLNSLDFSCQIIVQSRRLNITGYFEKLKEMEKEQKNELLKVQTVEYRKFVQELLSKGTIMTKQFFVVIPYSTVEIGGLTASLGLSGFGKKKKIEMNEELFQHSKDQLFQRMEFVAIGLRRCGLSVVPLTTPELIELFWSWHHPREAEVGYYPEILPELIK